ncbi:hypothetical protein A2853_03125 [Candidatus Kaiserbacteria bacterium RIFCSPHIGHO2_01_FULL_55_17]|uniref:DNA replication/recombination mediator RecO N-terminal domain-containing protein n=1 Tax=Candidatus Kaiserbacteria bacterium RIFCSPHIGHO2_01_FULL_55_17 TaxID=1798484 RepID=A0A1F6D8Z6_9BACT|nr:MAG: hypothetical protein A2853_03125 [Candidatus Kaiserbacteria bacterium RIFCSPHIGHO2_01_FULL_55_17]
MYQKYYTEALVLGSRERGEADRVFVLYTEDFGLVYARASAVRKETSRMRYALQHFSRARVALVRGKHGWRLGGATIEEVSESPEGIATFARIARLVLRLVAGEERNEYLFAALAEAHGVLMKSGREAFATIEIVCVARTLFALGYLSSEALETAIFTHTAYTGELLSEAETMRDKLLSSINRAIAETHL